MNDGENTVLGCIGALVGGVIMMIGAYMVNGWVLLKLWAWFVMPLFDVAPLTVAQAIGLGVTVGLVTHQGVPTGDNRNDSNALARAIAQAFVIPLVALLVGWIVSYFV